MMRFNHLMLIMMALLMAASADSAHAAESASSTGKDAAMEKIRKSDSDWKKELSPKEFEILRNKQTEAPFTGELLHNKKEGSYRCAACGAELFQSDTKYDSGSGWPSFWAAANNESIATQDDWAGGMHRTEILCARCQSHLGHLFEDGPEPTGKRYCVNSASLKFTPASENK